MYSVAVSGVVLVVVLLGAAVVPGCAVRQDAELRVRVRWATACETQAHTFALQAPNRRYGRTLPGGPR